MFLYDFIEGIVLNLFGGRNCDWLRITRYRCLSFEGVVSYLFGCSSVHHSFLLRKSVLGLEWLNITAGLDKRCSCLFNICKMVVFVLVITFIVFLLKDIHFYLFVLLHLRR